jgi:poly [ADP-ribose] polymerase
MLNQTNIGHNNNKFYIIQVIEHQEIFHVWNRWGRVGENGANSVRQYDEVGDAIKDFEKKFQDKTKNQWENRNKFKPVAGKYTMLDMGDDEEEEVAKVRKKAINILILFMTVEYCRNTVTPEF